MLVQSWEKRDDIRFLYIRITLIHIGSRYFDNIVDVVVLWYIFNYVVADSDWLEFHYLRHKLVDTQVISNCVLRNFLFESLFVWLEQTFFLSFGRLGMARRRIALWHSWRISMTTRAREQRQSDAPSHSQRWVTPVQMKWIDFQALLQLAGKNCGGERRNSSREHTWRDLDKRILCDAWVLGGWGENSGHYHTGGMVQNRVKLWLDI